jgi:predicted Zn-dependent protease
MGRYFLNPEISLTMTRLHSLRLHLPLGLVIAVGLFACTTVPDTGRRSFNFIPNSHLNEMGLTEFEKMKSQKRLSQNAVQQAAVTRIAGRLKPVIPIQNAQWEFVLFDDAEPNAFALPGGKVGVNSGIFKVAQTDAQLAAVIGHELAHVVAGHSGERMSTGMLSTAAVVGVGLLIGDDASDAQRTAATTGAGAIAGLGMLRFSRGQELEADKLGALYMARAGYDPRESITLWKNFSAYEGKTASSRSAEFLSTHPLDSTRIATLEAWMPRALEEYRP